MRNRGNASRPAPRQVPVIGARIAAAALLLAAAVPATVLAQSERVKSLNTAFAEHVRGLPADKADQARFVLESWKTEYAGENAEAFVTDGLMLLYPPFGDAVEAFDDGRYEDAGRMLEPLARSEDAFLSANAGYFYARTLVERGLNEEAEAFLRKVATEPAKLAGLTPYAGHYWFVKGFTQYSNLRFDESVESLEAVVKRFPDAPEPVTEGARQLLLEIERREKGTLGEVSRLMGYAAGRLKVDDGKQRVREKQDEAVALLDKLIEEAQEKEKNCSGCGQCKGGKKGASKSNKPPANPAEQSETRPGAGEIGTLRPAEKAEPGEAWGKLPPAEREKILQSLRDRFPSRYRELVEQYYRSLAEEK
jgi:tetratricopeptide (TPR) repeat protein